MQVTKLVSVVDLKKSSENLNKYCGICQREKQIKKKVFVSDFIAYDVFALIHCDLWYTYKNVSSCGTSIFLTIDDDYSRAMWIYLLVDKKEVSHIMKMFLSTVDH